MRLLLLLVALSTVHRHTMAIDKIVNLSGPSFDFTTQISGSLNVQYLLVDNPCLMYTGPKTDHPFALVGVLNGSESDIFYITGCNQV